MLDTGMVMAGYILFCFFASAIGASEFCTSLVSFAVVFIAMMFGVLVVVSTNAMENVYYFSGAVSIVLILPLFLWWNALGNVQRYRWRLFR